MNNRATAYNGVYWDKKEHLECGIHIWINAEGKTEGNKEVPYRRANGTGGFKRVWFKNNKSIETMVSGLHNEALDKAAEGVFEYE